MVSSDLDRIPAVLITEESAEEKVRDKPRSMVARALSAEAVEQLRAERASATAARHEASMMLGSVLSDHHASMARTHRRSEARHRAAAELYRAYAIRLMNSEDRSELDVAASLVAAAATLMGARHAAVTFVDGPRELGVLASDPTARAAHEWEFILGEGPGHDSVTDGPVLVGEDGLRRRWPNFGAAVGELGIDSVGAVPLRAHEVQFGSLIAFELSEPLVAGLTRLGQVADALVRVLIDGSREGAAHDIAVTITNHIDHHELVHRAAGVLSGQLACSIDDALARLRARAFVDGLEPTELARRVLNGEACIVD